MDFLDSFFEDSGSKIKLYAKIIFIINAISFIIMGIISFFITDY